MEDAIISSCVAARGFIATCCSHCCIITTLGIYVHNFSRQMQRVLCSCLLPRALSSCTDFIPTFLLFSPACSPAPPPTPSPPYCTPRRPIRSYFLLIIFSTTTPCPLPPLSGSPLPPSPPAVPLICCSCFLFSNHRHATYTFSSSPSITVAFSS